MLILNVSKYLDWKRKEMTYFYLIPQKESKHAINEQGNKGRKNRFGLNQQRRLLYCIYSEKLTILKEKTYDFFLFFLAVLIFFFIIY